MDRRTFLARTPVVIAAVWVTPTILEVKRADAATVGSRPPKTPPESHGPPGANVPPVEQPPAATLPFTGNWQDREVIIGGAAVVAGAVLAISNSEKRAEA